MTITQIPQDPREKKKVLTGCMIAAFFCFFLLTVYEGNIYVQGGLMAIIAGVIIYARMLLGSLEEDEK